MGHNHTICKVSLIRKGDGSGGDCYKIVKVYSDDDFHNREIWKFQHETFDLGQTDEEALESFRKFVYRKQELNYKNGHQENDSVSGNNKPFHCLMGAEDRWRWKGTQEGNSEQPTDAPCRCKHCKEQGMIRIGH